MTEGYQYNQLSPSQSPTGPTYTQLSGGARGAAPAPYHAAPTPGKWGSMFSSAYLFVSIQVGEVSA